VTTFSYGDRSSVQRSSWKLGVKQAGTTPAATTVSREQLIEAIKGMNENELKEVNELLSSGMVEILSEGGQGEVI
jgi:hypothetical protein